MGNMDDGEVDLSDTVLLPNPNADSSANFQTSTPLDSLLDEFLRNTRTCTHAHTCNPPGPDGVHTHTCYHTHMHVFTSEEDELPNNRDRSSLKVRRPWGNREAVKKYREKKKAHTAYLEEEVKKLRVLNQQLVRKLQGQAILEAEVLRLRSLLLDLIGKIDDELGVSPFQKHCGSTIISKDGDCGVQLNGGATGLGCQTELPCFHPQAGSSSQANVGGNRKMMASWEANCQPAIVDCVADTNGMALANGKGHHLDTVELESSILGQRRGG